MRSSTKTVKAVKSLCFTFVLLLMYHIGAAQFITYPVPAEPITRGLDSTLLTVQISFPACTDVSVTVNLGATNAPGLIEYIPGSVTKVSGVGTITESNITNLASPVFTIGNTTLGQTLRFTLRRRAYCGTAASSKDNIVVTGTGAGCNFSETNTNVNTYTIFSPALSITPPAALVSANVGSTYERTISVINGGNGCADTIGFWIRYPASTMVLNSLSFGAGRTPIAPKFTNGDSSYFELGGSVLGPSGKLCNGQSVQLYENVTILTCNVNTSYGAAAFDFANSRCLTANAVSGMSMSNAIPSVSVSLAPNTLPTCFVAAPRTFTYTITNTGAGPATNIVINTGNQLSNIPRGDSYGYIDTSSLSISLPDGSTVRPPASYYTAFTTSFNSTGVNSLACNAGRIAHLQLTLPANIILGAGQSITLTYNIVYCPSSSSCNDVYTGNPVGSQVLYRNACGNTSYTTGNYVGSNSFPYNVPSLTSFEFPAQVRSGDCYDVVLSTINLPTNNTSARGYIQYELSIPAGVTFNSATLVGLGTPHAGYPRVVGNKVITRYNVGTGGTPVKFNFCTPTGLCSTLNLDATLTVSPDSSCEVTNAANINSVKRCASSPIQFVCSNPCADGGTVPVYWRYARKNYGEPDNNFNKIADGSGVVNPSVVFRDRYRAGDTLHSEHRSYVIEQAAPSTISSWAYLNANWNFSGHIWAPAGTATVTIKRGGVTTSANDVTISVVRYGKEFNADFSQSATLSALAPFVPSDSVIVEADFVLKDSLLSASNVDGHMTVVDDGTRGKTFADAPDIVVLTNSVHASIVANPAPADRFTCFVPAYNANTLHLFHFSLLNGNVLSGCAGAKHEIRGYTRKLGAYSANYFPGEYRPEFIPDSLVIFFPVGMTVIPGTQSITGLFVAPAGTAVPNASIQPYVAINGSAATGTTVIFDTRAALAANPNWKFQSEGTTYFFGIDARGSCATPNTFTIAGRQTGHIFQWPSPVNEARYDDSARSQLSSSFSNQNKPNVNLSSPDATSTPGSDTALWTVLLQNSSAQQAPLNFIRIANSASFENIVVKLGNTVLTPNADGLYEVGSIGANATASLSIAANTNSCAIDSIRVESGWDCAAYPTGLALSAYNCWKSLSLRANPLLSQIQLSVERQPIAPSIELCTTDTMIFKINSALANYADNAEFRVTAPIGMVISQGEIEYPDGSGNWETIAPVDDNGVLVYSVEAHSLVTDAGLPGTIVNPGTANRAANLRLTYTTSCDFVSGSKISVQQRADRPCGTAISTDLGFNSIVRANPIKITGAPDPGIVGFNLALTPGSIACGTATLAGSLTPSGESTTATDTVVVTLPLGVVYAGNFVSADGITVAPGFPVAGPGGTEVLKLKVPAGISSGNQAFYSFDVQSSYVNFGCGKLNISSELQRTVGPFTCNGVACPNTSKAILGSADNILSVFKPDLSITSFEVVSGTFAPGGTAVIALTVANNGAVAGAAGSYKVEFFCGGSTTPFTSATFGPAIPVNSSAQGNVTITIPDVPVCNYADAVTAALRPLTAANEQQCMCQETIRPILQVLPVKLGSFTATQQHCKIQLNWNSLTESNLRRYEVEYSTNGRDFNGIATVAARGDNSNYNYGHQPAQGRAYYRLKMQDVDGQVKYSTVIAMNSNCTGKNILIYPNPANSSVNVNLSGYNGTVVGKLYNNIGQLIQTKVLINGTNNFNTEKLATGTYALVVGEEKNVQQVYKIQVAHQ